MSAVAGSGVDIAVIVCPAWWSSARIDRAQQAARTVATDVVLLERIAMLREGVSAETTIVEITSDVAIVTVFEKIVAVVPRQGELVADAEAVVAAVGAPAGVLVDAPASVFGAGLLASLVCRSHARHRSAGQDRRRRLDPARRRGATIATFRLNPRRSRFEGRAGFATAGRLLCCLACCRRWCCAAAVAAVHDSSSDRVDDMPMTLLVEGRVGLMVPATWTTQRITSGPGSARVQVVSPTDGGVALHVTQSVLAQPSSLAKTADTLLAALAESADGAFVDFNPSDRRADRDAVTYREIRPERTRRVDGIDRRDRAHCDRLPEPAAP